VAKRIEDMVAPVPQLLKAAARPLYDRLAGSGRVLPDFLIVGAMKAGTSSLHAHLCPHPQAIVWPRKEVHFFDKDYARGPYWYRRHFPRRSEVAQRERALGKPVAVGEATPCYLFDPLAAARIAALMPAAKLIVLLRDPVARAYSHYRHAVRKGREPLGFLDALAAEDERLQRADAALARGDTAGALGRRYFSYRARSLYLEQLRRYYDAMPAAQILVLRSEDMFRDPASIVSQATAFLGLDPWQPPDLAPRNQAPEPAGTVPGEAELRAFFAPHNAALYAFLGRDMGW